MSIKDSLMKLQRFVYFYYKETFLLSYTLVCMKLYNVVHYIVDYTRAYAGISRPGGSTLSRRADPLYTKELSSCRNKVNLIII